MSLEKAPDLPRHWNVPYPRSPLFTGRADDFDRLKQHFARRMPHTPVQAIHGLGGIGKTQLALEYAYRYAGEYSVVWWLRAEDPATLAADLADLAVELRLPGSVEPDQRAAIGAVKHWLAHNDRWLLVFDSARDPRDVADYIPSPVTGHILITSRFSSWGAVAWPLQLRGLVPSDSVALLLKRTGAEHGLSLSPPTLPGDPPFPLVQPEAVAAARDLATELGHLPLALAQAAGYIEGAGIGIAEYLARFRERRMELMKRGAQGDTAPTVATTWDIAFRDVSARSPAAGELLDLCAFLGPDDIARDALNREAARFPPALSSAVGDPLALDDAIQALRRYSLIDAHDDVLSVHRLVQVAVRDRLAEAGRRRWAEVAVAFVSAIFPHEPDDPAERALCRRWLPHARAVLENARAADVPPLETEESLLRHAAKYQHVLGFDRPARDMLERAVSIAEAIHGPDHPHVAMALTGLGTAMMNLRDLSGAEGAARRALAIDMANHGAASPVVATDAINLAAVLRQGNMLADARVLAERALAIDEAFGLESEAVARDANNLGAILRDLGDLPGARRCFERAIAIDARRGTHDLARRLNNLAAVLREMRHLEEARDLAERALAMGQETYGPEDPDVATFHSNLAFVLHELGLERQDRGRIEEARDHLKLALRIGESTYGEDHYAVAIRHNNLGLILNDLRDFSGALLQLDRAVEIAKKALGPEHRRVKKLERNRDAVRKRLTGSGPSPRR